MRVVAVEQVTPQIKHFTLAPVAGGELPAFSGGSHIIVVMRGAAARAPQPVFADELAGELDNYQISVRRMEQSRGGSHFMHDQVRVGSALEIAHPVNLFALASWRASTC